MESPPCAGLPAIMYFEERPLDFTRRLEQVDAANFQRLFRCGMCGQHWRIDDWDKYQVRIAVKIADPASWLTFDASTLEKELLLRTRGGAGTEGCAWANCPNPALAGMAICVDHLVQSGVRR